MRKISTFFFIGILLSLYISSYAQSNNGFIGYATATVTDSSVLTSEFGFSNFEKKLKYNKNTVQPVGSVSKTLIGVSILIAREQGFVDLDTDINNYLDFALVNPYFGEKENIITLRDLATHTSGIKDVPKYYKKAYSMGTVPEMPLGQYLKEYLVAGGNFYSRKNFDRHLAGRNYSYSNIAAALAAYVLERATGMPFDEFTEKNILKPLGMNHSGWSYSKIDQSQHAILYSKKNIPEEPYTLITYPDGGFRTTIQDLSLYLQELIKGYNHQSDLMSDESWDELFRRNFSEDNPVKNVDKDEPNSGIFFAYSKSGKIGHTGSDPGVSAVMWFDPQTGIGNLFMANKDITNANLDAFKEIWRKIKNPLN